MDRRAVLAAPLLGALLGVAGCARTIGVYRYRVTVEVETPQGLRSGASVMEISYGDQLSMQGGRLADVRQKGEAIYVDLGQGKYIVALLNTGRMLPLKVLYDQLGWDNESIDELERRKGKLTGKVTLKGWEIPTMVTFTDPTDPTSFKIVYQTKYNRQEERKRYFNPQTKEGGERILYTVIGPEILQDNFASLFGAGYALKSVTLEVVDRKTPVTRWVAQKFLWLDDPKYTKNPGWMNLSEEVRSIFTSLRFFER